MHGTQTDETTQRIAEAALARMQALGISPTPRNYEIFYTYFAGTHPDLTKALDVLTDSGAAVTEAQTRELYQRFFARDQHWPTLNHTTERLETAITQVLSVLDAGANAADATGERIATLSGDLVAHDGGPDVHATVRELLQETRAILQRNRDLERQLQSSSAEVNELRRDLESVRREAITDGLTGIANRKMFDQRLREVTDAARDSGTRVALVIVDIDHFKAFNDRYGHDVGDEVLKLVARHLHDQIKGRDTAARFGGEEFALLLPDTRARDAAGLADRIRAGLAAHHLTSRTTQMRYGRITLSAGVAEYRHGEPPESLVRRTDQTLYAAKRAGRNTVVRDGGADD